ncbi:hypothetical protein ABPG77_010665 [Micractinium sp. CCAP 211/92]
MLCVLPMLCADLEEVDLYENNLERLPPALAAATGLTRLLAGSNPLGPGTAQPEQLGPQPPEHDPLAVLCQLPRLRELCLASTAIDGLPEGQWLTGGAATRRGWLCCGGNCRRLLARRLRRGQGSASRPPRRLLCPAGVPTLQHQQS